MTKLETILVLSAFSALLALNLSKVPKFFCAAANFLALNCSMAFLYGDVKGLHLGICGLINRL